MLRVFTDFHHAGLLHSLILLFEGRLGGTVYRPIGMDWYKQGYWNVYDHPATALQYLGTNAGTPDGSKPLNEVQEIKNEVYYCQDIDSNLTNKAIEFDTFTKMQFDVIIASLPQHLERYRELQALYQPQAALVYQIGNKWEANSAENVLASARLQNVPENINYIEYHQEFDLEVFKYQDQLESNPPKISSFINVYQNFTSWRLFEAVEKLLAGRVVMKSYGGQCRDGVQQGYRAVAAEMHRSSLVWHVKDGGDGYGHIIHNAFAVGRPPIVRLSDYQNTLAVDLMIDGETCIAIDGLNEQQIVEKILDVLENREKLATMSKNAYTRFTQVVNFDNEAEAVRRFIEQCQ